MLKRYAGRTDHEHAFFMPQKIESSIVSDLAIAKARWDVAQAGSLGDWMGVPLCAPQGYMAGLHM